MMIKLNSKSYISYLKKIALKYLHLLNYFLDIEVSTLPNRDVMFTQSKYIKELLLKAKMDSSKPIFTPT